jgi:heat shock protein HslJ
MTEFRQNIILLIISLMLLSCNALHQSSTVEAENLDGRWTLVALNEQTLGNKDEITALTLEINNKEQKVFVQSACNRFSGTIQKNDSNKLLIKNLIGTKVFCDGINTERKYTEALNKTVRYEVSDTYLSFYNAEGEIVAKFQRSK